MRGSVSHLVVTMALLLALFRLSAPEARAESAATECDPLQIQVATMPSPPRSADLLRRAEDMAKDFDPADKTVVIGDSLAKSWPSRLLSPPDGAGVLNLGQGGDMTQHVLWRLDHLDLKSIHPSRAIVFAGTNNLKENEAPCAIAAGVGAIIDRIHAAWPEAEIVILQVPPRGTGFGYKQEERQTLNALLADLAKRRHAETVNLDDALGVIGLEKSPLYQDDNLHFRIPGYEVITRQLHAGPG